MYLQFGDGLAKTLTYERTNNRFNFNDNVNIEGDASVTGNLGVGTTTADAVLDVESSGSDEFIRLTDATSADSIGIYNGAGSPESLVTAQLGSLYFDNFGGGIYKKHTGDGTNTGWEELAISTGAHLGRMTRSAQQTIGQGASVKIAFDSETFDEGGVASTTTDLFTIHNTGSYIINAGWTTNNTLDNSESMQVCIFRNGIESTCNINTSSNNNQVLSVQVSDILSLNQGDEIEMYVEHTDNNNVLTNTTSYYVPFMSIAELGATGAGATGGGGGISIGEADDRYVNITGDTMSGELVFDMDSDSNAIDIASLATTEAAVQIDIAGDSDSPHILFGESGLFDTNLYRESADVLKTDDSLFVGGTLTGQILDIAGGAFTVSSDGSVTAEGTAIFNQDGDASNFRVESDNDQNLFFIHGTSDQVGIGTSTPSSKLEVKGGISGSTIIATNGLQGAGLSDCDDPLNDKLMWDLTTNQFSCGADQGSGAGGGGIAAAGNAEGFEDATTDTSASFTSAVNVWDGAQPNITPETSSGLVLVAAVIDVENDDANNSLPAFQIHRNIGSDASCSDPVVGITFYGTLMQLASGRTQAVGVFLDQTDTNTQVRYTICTAATGTDDGTVNTISMTLAELPTGDVGISEAEANTKYVQKSGDTMTGALTIDQDQDLISFSIDSEATTEAGLQIDITGSENSPHILFGENGVFDTNLFRSAANTLKTEDSLFVSGTLSGQVLNVAGGAFAVDQTGNTTISATLNVTETIDATGNISTNADVSADGSVTINSDQSGDATLTFGNNIGNHIISMTNGSQTIVFSTGATFTGDVAGTTVTGFGLTDCDNEGQELKWDATTNQFNCIQNNGDDNFFIARSTDGADFNANPRSITWESEDAEDTDHFTHATNASAITLETTGWYRVSYNLSWDQINQNNRTSLRCYLFMGSEVPGTITYGYARDDGIIPRGTCGGTFMIENTVASTDVELRADLELNDVDWNDSDPDVVETTDGVSIVIEYLGS